MLSAVGRRVAEGAAGVWAAESAAVSGLRRAQRQSPSALVRAKSESQSGWEGLLNDLYRRGLRGRRLQLVIPDGCPGLAAAIPAVYPRARHQRCWVHKMRNLCEAVRRADHDAVKQEAQRIYQAPVPLAERSSDFGCVGGPSIPNWWSVWNGIYRHCWRFSSFHGTCGESCAPPMPSRDALSRCGGELGPWSCS